MTYLRSLFLNFLIVFFVDRAAPGIQITDFEQVPNIWADLLFSIVVGFLNGSVFPLLYLLELKVSVLRLSLISFFFTFISFGAISVFPFGVQVVSPLGFFVGGGIVWIVAVFSNYLEWRHSNPRD